MGAFVFALLLAGLVPVAQADYAVLSGGRRLHITGWQRVGDSVRLDLDGGSVTLPAGELISVEPEEVFPASALSVVPDVPYGEQIRTAALRNGVDPLLVASIISVESNFNSRAISPKSAFGLMQLQPRTAAELSVRNLFDPAQNIEAGTHYLKELLDRYGQNLPLALAAYNAGPDRVARYRGVPPFRETQDYIRRVNARLEKQKNANRSTPLWPLSLPPTP
jgi:soluble lytic murein transglycosylase-like protein